MAFSLRQLERRVAQRAKARAKESYTRALLDKGVGHCGKKLREEAGETARAAASESSKRVVAESADLLYHLLVLLKARRVTLADVEAELGRRTAQSGHAEKASRRKRRSAKQRRG
jgi:phosphoribosyl-ATP pyrophosphohydrolase